MTPEQYRAALGCQGATHTMPVPVGMTVDEAIAECATLGHLDGDPTIAEWVTVECPGGPGCWCLAIDCTPTYRHFHNDVQVYP